MPPFKYARYCVPLSHISWLWSKPSRSVAKPRPNHWVTLSRHTPFVVATIALLTQTLPQRRLVDQLVSLRRSRPGTLSIKGLRLIAHASCGSRILVAVVDPSSRDRHQNHY